MRCARCHREAAADAKFCEHCGAPIVAICLRCGAALPPAARFCPGCGERVAGASEGRPPSTESYTPKHLAQKILTSKSALEGERKQITVLFADVKSSLELLATRDPEEAREIIDPVLQLMMEAVHHYEGTVNQVMGDGIMALFGAPLAHEDHAVRACYAGLRMQQSLKQYRETTAAGRRFPVEIRIGLNSGDVVVRSIGSDLQMDYSAIGETAHLASRMEQLAPAGTILATARTLSLADGYVDSKPLGLVSVRGIAEPLDVYDITGVLQARTRLHASAGRGLTRFVGRRPEMEILNRAVERVGQRCGQIVALVGEAGVGKSRVAWELTHMLRSQGHLVVESGAVSYAKTTPYVAVIGLLKEYFQIEGLDDVGRIRDMTVRKMLTLDATLESSVAPILALLDVPVDEPSWETLDPLQRRQRTLEAIKRLFLRESEVQPVALVVEDLHWIDAETQAVLDKLADTISDARMLLLVNYRRGYQHAWATKTYYTLVRIDPLSYESAEELLALLLGTDAELAALKKLLIERTEGNPFFLEESVRILIETRSLVPYAERYRLTRPLAAIKIPATVQTVLAARIDRLADSDKRLLQTAAVIGRDVPYELLREIAEVEGDTLQACLVRLQAAEFLCEAKTLPHVEYAFKHALTHEVAYESLVQLRRRRLHAEITDAIERLYPDRLTEQVDVLAHHSLAGELWEKSVHYLRRAAIKAASHSASREAVERFEQALRVLDRLPQTKQRFERELDIRNRLGNCFWTLGEFVHMHEHVRLADALATRLDDRRRLGQISATRSHCGWLLGDIHHAMEHGRRALTIAEECADVALRIRATYFVAQGWESLGDYRRAAGLQQTIIDVLDTQSAHTRFGMAGVPAAWCRFSLAWCLAELGEFAAAEARAVEAMRIAELVDDALGRVAAEVAVGFVGLRAGHPMQSLGAGQRALDLCRSANIIIMSPLAAFVRGAASVQAGCAAAAVSTLTEAVHQAATIEFLVYQPLLLAALSEAHLHAGSAPEAGKYSEQALGLARERHERGYEAWILRFLGDIASRQQPPDRAMADRRYREALALARELGMRPLVAHCRLGLGRIAHARGDAAAAACHLDEAAALFGAMGSRTWIEHVEREHREHC